MQSKTKRPINPWGDDHPEKLRDGGSDWQEQIKGIFNPADQLKGLVDPANFIDQLFGTSHSQESAPAPQAPEKPRIKANETVVFSREKDSTQRELEQQTQMVLDKLKQQATILEKKQKALTGAIAKVKVEQMPRDKQGIYTLRFLEWLVGQVNGMLIKVDQGAAWLAEFSNKQKKKMGYWAKNKKHGTSFSLSNERTLATQTG